MIIYLMLLISIYERAARSVLGLQRGGLPRFTRALPRFVTVALTRPYGFPIYIRTPCPMLSGLSSRQQLRSCRRAIILLPRHIYYTRSSKRNQILLSAL